VRLLILGAGGIGGYFGGRLVESGADVTFLVREAKAAQLRRADLIVESPLGDIRTSGVAVTNAAACPPSDVVILTCKAYDLPTALDAIAPAVHPATIIVPLLNGLAHLDVISERFPAAAVWGGLAHLGVTMTSDGVIHHLNSLNTLMFGPRGTVDERAAALAALFASTPVEARASERIEQDLWDKFVFVTALAGMTCLMRASVGTIVAVPGGERLMLQLLAECSSVAEAHGHAPNPEQLERYRDQLTQRRSSSKASMLLDVERGSRTEGEHLLGDMLARAKRLGFEAPLLEIAAAHIRAYEHTREHQASQPTAKEGDHAAVL